MPRRRAIDRLPEPARLRALLWRLSAAVGDKARDGDIRRTDVVGIACQYGRSWGARRADFAALLGERLADVVARVDAAHPARGRRDEP